MYYKLMCFCLQVCEVYRLHRETFYLAMDFVDRFLSITQTVQKQQLQLLGISSLFISSKIEVRLFHICSAIHARAMYVKLLYNIYIFY